MLVRIFCWQINQWIYEILENNEIQKMKLITSNNVRYKSKKFVTLTFIDTDSNFALHLWHICTSYYFTRSGSKRSFFRFIIEFCAPAWLTASICCLLLRSEAHLISDPCCIRKLMNIHENCAFLIKICIHNIWVWKGHCHAWCWAPPTVINTEEQAFPKAEWINHNIQETVM